VKKHKKPESFIRSPSYPGGNKAMDLFVRENLVYPEEAIRMKITGKVSIMADIDHKGKVIKTVVKKGIGFGCDEEAARVVSLMQFEGLHYRGLRVVFHKTINISFTLPGSPKGAEPETPGFTYSYKENQDPGKPVTYQYTIREN